MTPSGPGTAGVDAPDATPVAGRRSRSVARWLLVLLFGALPLATSVHEIAMGLALAVALFSPPRGLLLREPWGRPTLAAALVWVLFVPASGDLREGLGHAWLLAPFVAVPVLVTLATGGVGEDRAGAAGGRPNGHAAVDGAADGAASPGTTPTPADARALVVRVGLGAAGLAAAWALAQRALGDPGTAGFSHHLSLAYALLPPLGVALASGRHAVAALLAAGVLATGSAGAVLALATTLAAALTRRPTLALAVGVAATVGSLPLADAEELRQRAVLWTGGLAVAEGGPAGPGAYAAASAPAYDALVPGFWFPNHAHDSAIQLLAVLGPAGLCATLLLCLVLLRRAAPGPAAGLAGVLVGALTQEVLGDLEVARAAWAWAALFGAAGTAAAAAPLAATSREPRDADGD